MSSSSSAAAEGGKPPANLLAQIRRHSQVIVDTADYEQVPALSDVQEATTNPSIVWQAAQQEKYFHLLEETFNVRGPTPLHSVRDVGCAVSGRVCDSPIPEPRI